MVTVESNIKVAVTSAISHLLCLIQVMYADVFFIFCARCSLKCFCNFLFGWSLDPRMYESDMQSDIKQHRTPLLFIIGLFTLC